MEMISTNILFAKIFKCTNHLKKKTLCRLVNVHESSKYFICNGMCLESLSSFQGPFSWIKWKTELDLLADFLYFGLTTISGRPFRLKH